MSALGINKMACIYVFFFNILNFNDTTENEIPFTFVIIKESRW